jgi:phosphoglycerate dehydrogenase-like enzyme
VKVLVPAQLSLVSPGGAPHQFVAYDPASPVPDEHRDAQVLVAFGNTGEQLADSAARLPHLRLVQSLSAGSDAVLAAGFAADVTIASGRTLHNDTVAEHSLALILSALRSIPALTRLQAKHEWSADISGHQSEAPDQPIITLNHAEVTIWGFGSIGQTLAPLLRSLGARVVGIAQSAGERAGFPVIDSSGISERLAVTDILVCILPGTDANRNLVGASRMAELPSRAWIVNVGRGSTLDETALVRALRAGELAGAALDVFAVEPLPAGSPLWDEPNVIITPHSAGGRPRGAGPLIQRNLDALAIGEPLVNVVAGPGRAAGRQQRNHQ